MFNLLVVDDEWIIREGLEKTIPWHSWGINLVATAKNSDDALKIIDENKINIILTDIRMPGSNGLELSSNIKSRFPCKKVVILTGHSEFNYAQKAIKLGADDFLIKPTNVIELESTMLRMVNELSEEELEQKSLVSLVIRNALENTSDENLKDLYKYDFLHPSFGFFIIEGNEINLNEIVNSLLIDQQDNTYIYFSHTIKNTAHWNSIINEVKDALIAEKVNAKMSVSLLSDSLLDVYKQANAASTKMYQDSNLSIYTYHDEKYALDIEDAILYIKKNYDKPINQAELSTMFNVSNSYFSRLFKQHTGQKFSCFLTSERMLKAKDLLKSTNLKTYEIAMMVGYSESRYFSQLFKKKYNCTPMEYRHKSKRTP